MPTEKIFFHFKQNLKYKIKGFTKHLPTKIGNLQFREVTVKF